MTVTRPLCTGANGKPAEFATTDTLGGIAALQIDATANEIVINQGLAADANSLAVGHDALLSTTSGTYNVAVGMAVGAAITIGSNNVIAGNVACSDLVSGDKNIVLGYNVSGVVTKDSNVIVGSDITAGDNDRQILIGHAVVPEGANKTVIGSDGQTDTHLFGTLKIGDGTDATKTATISCASITTGTNRTFTLPDASGTIVIGGGTCSGTSSGTNTGDQTSVSGNAGTATALQTARAIYGNNFDGTAALTQVIASTYGGTGNGFTKFAGPTTAERTKTLRDASDTILELGGSYTPTGTWTSLTLVTPALGTPGSGTLTNCAGLPVDTGISGLASGVATFLATPTSANLLAAVTNETGTGALVFADSPTFGASIGVGGAASSTSSLFTQGNQLTGTTQYAFRTQTTANESATAAFYGQATQVRTKATSFTCALGAGVKVLDGSVGAASTLTTQVGVDIDPLTVGGTNNYGIRSTVAGSATGGFNLYVSGTAPNYFNGQLAYGVTSTATAAGTTTLTRSSTMVQVFTGTTTQSVTLPAANLYGSGIGVSFIIKNRSTGTVTINRAGSDTIDGATSYTLTGSANAAVRLISNGSSEWLVM